MTHMDELPHAYFTRCASDGHLARQFTMVKFITRDAIGLFNRDACTANPATTAWQADLLNTPVIVGLLCDRLHADYENTAQKFRKPYTFAQVDSQLKLSVDFLFW